MPGGHIKHGESKTKLYVLWQNMKRGSRGKVRAEWVKKLSYEDFREWAVSRGYSDNTPYISLIDYGDGYAPTNCMFVSSPANIKGVTCLETLKSYPTARKAKEDVSASKGYGCSSHITTCCKNVKALFNGGNVDGGTVLWSYLGKHWMFTDDAFALGILPERCFEKSNAAINAINEERNKRRFKYSPDSEMGKHRKRLKGIWGAMKQRCGLYKGATKNGIKNYAERGITVCPEWADSVDSFIGWSLENGYSEGLSIDRIDNDKGYCPDNCRWVTKLENREHKRNSGDCVCLETLETFPTYASAYRSSRPGFHGSTGSTEIKSCCVTAHLILSGTYVHSVKKTRFTCCGLHWVRKEDAEKYGLLPGNYEAAQMIIKEIESHR